MPRLVQKLMSLDCSNNIIIVTSTRGQWNNINCGLGFSLKVLQHETSQAHIPCLYELHKMSFNRIKASISVLQHLPLRFTGAFQKNWVKLAADFRLLWVSLWYELVASLGSSDRETIVWMFYDLLCLTDWI